MSEAEIEHADRLRRVVEAGISISAQLSIADLLEKIVATAVELTDATYGALGVLVAGGKSLETFVTVGVDEARRQEIGPLPTGRGVLGMLISEAKPVRLADLTEDPRSVGFPPGHPMMRSFLGVPILLRGSPYGNLYLTEKRGASEFSEEDQGIAELFAAQAAIAVENARLYEAVRRWNGQLESLIEGSNRLAREIDPAYVRQSVVDQVRDLLDSDAALLILQSSDHAMHVDAVAGRVPESLVGDAVDPWGSKWGRVL
ncbi:MAG: GAF domain-containing protein, partial [Gaiellaceae bacterium]